MPTDKQRLDLIEEMSLKYTRHMFGNRVKVGFIVSDQGDVLAGCRDVGYKHSSLREAIDEHFQKKT